MSQRTMEAHYRPNWNLTQAHNLSAYNCGYAERPHEGTFHANQQALVWRLLDGAPLTNDSTVLDVGSGIGGPAGWIMERFGPRRLVGVEYLWSSVQIAHGRSGNENAHHARFVQGDAHQLPLASASVDVIFNLESALHYPDKKKFLAECRRVLKPRGVLCLGDITTFRKWLFGMAALLNRIPSQFNSNIRLWSPDDYKRTFAEVGLELVRHENASINVANSLVDGLDQVKSRGWSGAAGYRGRFFYLAFLERLLRAGLLRYDLFQARPY